MYWNQHGFSDSQLKRVAKGNKGRCRKCVRTADMLRKYNLTREQYDEMMTKQKGLCPICEKPLEDGNIHIDHKKDSYPPKVRGILCLRCNPGLGQFVDDPGSCIRAATYLAKTDGLPKNAILKLKKDVDELTCAMVELSVDEK